jgi:dCMP deaminase
MKIAFVIKTRSNCMKRSVGAVLVKNKRLISSGYNGTPMGFKNCYEYGCERCNKNSVILTYLKTQGVDLHKCFCIHAEESAILEAGILNIKDSTIYTTLFPCMWCTKLLISAVTFIL